MTESVKTSLIAYDRKFDFITQAQSLMNVISNITATDSQSKGSAFSSCFFQALWRAVRSVCGLHRALANQEMAVCGCTAPWCWIMTCTLKFLSFQSVLSPEWLVTWPNSSVLIFHQTFSHHLAHLPGPRHPPLLEVA